MMLAWLFVAIVVGIAAVRLLVPRLPPSSTPDQARLLAQQAEQIEQLEEELRQVKEQADFTEKLLTERSSAHPDDEGDGPPLKQE